MKTARQWADEFCNRNVINVKGSEVQDFITSVQKDAQVELIILKSDSHFILNDLLSRCRQNRITITNEDKGKIRLLIERLGS